MLGRANVLVVTAGAVLVLQACPPHDDPLAEVDAAVDAATADAPDVAVVELGGCLDEGDVFGVLEQTQWAESYTFLILIEVPPRPDVIPAVVLRLEEVTPETLPLEILHAQIRAGRHGGPLHGARKEGDAFVDVEGGAVLPYVVEVTPPDEEGVLRGAVRLRTVSGELVAEHDLRLVSRLRVRD